MKLSVISITFNNLSGLKKTLGVFDERRFGDSVEIVIVDGGSKDGTAEFLRQQSLTKNWVSEPDEGIYNAMNKGLSMAHGDYVWFLNAGDYAEKPEIVNRILQTLNGNPDAVYGETMMVDAGGKALGSRSEISSRKLPESLNWKSFRMGMNVGHQSFILKRSLALPYDESYRYVADIDWMIRCLKHCKTVINIRSVIACFTMDGFSSVQRKNSNRERFRVLNKHYGLLPNILAHVGILFRKFLNPGKV